MDALLPPLDTFAVVELTAPPELNENSDSSADHSSKEMEFNAVEGAFLPTNSDGVNEPAAGHEDPSDVDSRIDDSANHGSAVKGGLQLKQCLDDFFEARRDDLATVMVTKKFADPIASQWLENDAETEVRDSLNGLLDAVISEVEGHPDALFNHLNDSGQDDEQVVTNF
jgi:hypothetical protein